MCKEMEIIEIEIVWLKVKCGGRLRDEISLIQSWHIQFMCQTHGGCYRGKKAFVTFVKVSHDIMHMNV